MGAGKDSGSSKTYDYFGTVAGLIAWGPVDGIHALWVDGKEIFAAPPGGLAAAGDFTVLDPVDEKWQYPGGYIRIYWGTPDSPPNLELGPKHPPYRGFCYVVFHKFLFGRERSMSPNIEAIVWRKPRPPAFLEPVDFEDGQVNPVAVMAEWLAGLIGLEQPDEIFDQAAWLAAAAWVWSDPDRRARMAISGLLVDTGDIRGRLAALLELTELALAWDDQGRLTLRRLDLGEAPSGQTLDARYTTSRTVIRAGGWEAVPTGLNVRFIDRDRRWKEAGQKIDNILAKQFRGEQSRQEVDLPWVTRASQAAAIAGRLLAIRGRPACDLSVQVRSASSVGLGVGSKVFIDVEPEPGGLALAQACIVTERREPRDGPVVLTLMADTLLPAQPYFPAWTSETPVPKVVLPILEALVIPLHPDAWALTAAVAVLAARPQPDAVGFRLYFAPASDLDSFTRLGDQAGFAVRVGLAAGAVDSLQGEWTLRLLDGPDGPDAYLAARTPADPGAAAQDELVVILAQLDVGGRVALDVDDGQPILEIASIVHREPVVIEPPDAGLHVYTILRGRKGTSPRPWPADAVGWILPLVNLTPWTHPRLAALARGTAEGVLRLVAFTRYGEDESVPIPERGFFLPVPYDVIPKIAWTLPAVNPAVTSAAGEVEIDVTASDPGGDLVRLSIVSRRGLDDAVPRLAEQFPQSQSRRFHMTLAFAGEGVHSLQVSARDSGGHEAIDIRQIVVPPAAGGPGSVPTFDPPSSSGYADFIYVKITAAAGHNMIAYRITDPQEEVPVMVGFPENEIIVQVAGTKYLWAASGVGSSTTSPVVYASYVRLSPVS